MAEVDDSACFICDGEREAVLVIDGWPLCEQCAERAVEQAAERLYGSSESRTVVGRLGE